MPSSTDLITRNYQSIQGALSPQQLEAATQVLIVSQRLSIVSHKLSLTLQHKVLGKMLLDLDFGICISK